MLDWFLSNGLRLDDITIRQKLEYSKSEWLKPYIEFIFRKERKLKLSVINWDMYSLN